jgi:hypothetical protein
VQVYEGNDLFLVVEPVHATVGSPIGLHTRGGEPGQLAFLFIVAANGTPFFRPLANSLLGLGGGWTVQGTVPASVGGNTIRFQSFALTSGGKIVDSEAVTADFN